MEFIYNKDDNNIITLTMDMANKSANLIDEYFFKSLLENVMKLEKESSGLDIHYTSIGSSAGTFHNVFMDSLNLDDDTIVYFLENDYIHAPNSMNALFDGFDKVINENELKFGYHGGEFETSLMLYLYPLLVKKNLIKKNALSPDFKSKSIISYEKNVKRAWNTEDINKSGIIGNPIGSSSLKGKQILDITLNTLKKIVMELS